MPPLRKPTWQQATALVSLSTCGAMTGFAFAHGTVDEMTSPTRMPVKLVALDKPAKPEQTGDSALRSAIVKVAKYYLRMAQSKSPAEMEAMIWGVDSVDGADHGESCAAFASLTLALGAQSTGQQSWVTGGTTYPWPLHKWADVRVDLNPDSPQIVSVMQDAQAHHRWHPLGDGYQPQPGDWVLFDGHVEVVTSYSPGALRTIGGDSAPNLSVNAHTFSGSLAAQGVNGFVNNGQLHQRGEPGERFGRGRHGDRRRFGAGRGGWVPGPGAGGHGRRGRAGNDAHVDPHSDGGEGRRTRHGPGSWRDGEGRYDQDGGHSRPAGEPRHAEHGGDAGRDGRLRRRDRRHHGRGGRRGRPGQGRRARRIAGPAGIAGPARDRRPGRERRPGKGPRPGRERRPGKGPRRGRVPGRPRRPARR